MLSHGPAKVGYEQAEASHRAGPRRANAASVRRERNVAREPRERRSGRDGLVDGLVRAACSGVGERGLIFVDRRLPHVNAQEGRVGVAVQLLGVTFKWDEDAVEYERWAGNMLILTGVVLKTG